MNEQQKVDLDSIDRICDRFESGWLNGQPEPIEILIAHAGFENRDGLLEELLHLELEYRVDSNERPDRSEYLSRFANQKQIVDKVFDQIENRLATANGLNDGTKGGSARGGGDSSPAERTSDRFEILGEHASGGLGTVYLALDREIARDVAVKKLHRNHGRSEDLRRRFQREADITGALEHPGVVPVYSAGIDENGAPFYAMRFVTGDTLQSVIEQFHARGSALGQNSEVALQKILRRFLDVCNTIGYAHSKGVVHRDLKPANIILGQFGETQIIDWGMAKRVHDTNEPEVMADTRKPSDPNSIQTQGGLLMGTPRYMSPEQAAGDVANVSFASDIYSLGATLYHLLTGEPPLFRNDIEEVIPRVIAGDIPAARSIKPWIPKPIAAICQKAMNVDPKQRYASAKELSTDLENYLATEPVSAYVEPWTRKLARWTRRHRTAVTAASVALMVLLASAIVALILLENARSREESAKQLAQQRNEQAKTYFRQARQAVDDYLGKVQADRKLQSQGLSDLRIELLNSAMGFYRKLANEKPDDPDLELDVIIALANLAAIHHELGQIDEEMQRLAEGRALALEILQEQPNDAEVIAALAGMEVSIAFIDRLRGKSDEARKIYQTAIDRFEKLSQLESDSHSYRYGYLASLINLGDLYVGLGQFEQAFEYFAEADAILKSAGLTHVKAQIARAELQRRMATAYALNNQVDKAIEQIRQCIDSMHKLCEEDPENLDLALQLVVDYSNYVQEIRDPKVLRPLAEKIVERFEPMLTQHDQSLQLRSSMSIVYRQIAEVLGTAGELEADEAIKLFQRAIELLQSIVETNPELVDYRRALAYTHYKLGTFYRKRDQESRLEPDLIKAIEIYQDLDQTRLDVLHPQAYCCYVLAVYYHRTNRLGDVRTMSQKGIPMYRRLSEVLVEDATIYDQWWSFYEVSYLALWNTGEHTAAIAQLKEVIGIAKNVFENSSGMIAENAERSLTQFEADLKMFEEKLSADSDSADKL